MDAGNGVCAAFGSEAALVKASAVAFSQAYPYFSSGSRWHPSAHSFQALMKINRSSALFFLSAPAPRPRTAIHSRLPVKNLPRLPLWTHGAQYYPKRALRWHMFCLFRGGNQLLDGNPPRFSIIVNGSLELRVLPCNQTGNCGDGKMGRKLDGSIKTVNLRRG